MDNIEEKPEGYELLMEFLDAETDEEKLAVIGKMAPIMSDYLIDTMAASMDVIVDDGDIDSRTMALKDCLRAKAKYEVRRG